MGLKVQGEIERQTDRQIDGQTDRQTEIDEERRQDWNEKLSSLAIKAPSGEPPNC